MIVDYEVELGRQTFFESREVLQALGVIDDNGDPNQYFVIGDLENPIAALDQKALSRLPNGKLIAHLFSHNGVPMITNYDDTYNAWHHLQGTWPPAIDTLVHLRGQRNSDSVRNARNILEVGCGTGMAGTYAVNSADNPLSIFFADIEANAVTSAADNREKFITRTPLGSSYLRADGLNIGKACFDVIVASAVPVTPTSPKPTRPSNHLFEGTHFLEQLLRDSPEHLTEGGRVIISHSSVGDLAFGVLAKKHGAIVDRVLYERDVAFRPEFLDGQPHVDFLLEQGGLKAEPIGDYPFRHTVRVKELRY